MRRNNKQITTTFILFSLLLIGVVYAILQANLQINGTAKIRANTWDIHFDNIQVNANSVPIGTGDSAATIDPENNCKVDFEVTLSIPGDFYEFTIDVVNAGTIDGMIGELNKTLVVNNEPVDNPPEYLDYSVTYSDGLEIEENHKISAGTTETYLVRLEFKTDIEELPSATTIATSLTPQYIQSDSNSINVIHYHELYDLLENEYNNNSGYVQIYTGEHKDSYTTNGTQTIYYWHAETSEDEKAYEILDKWNVLFNGFCWQAYRTTDTGGVKLIYNGLPNEGKCKNEGSNQMVGSNAYNLINDGTQNCSPAYFGYMYNPNTLISYKGEETAVAGYKYGNDVTYSDGTYTLVSTTTYRDNFHHYTCNNSSGNCTTVRYYYYSNYYTEISDGRNITQALNDMLYAENVNQVNSSIKTYIETWYQNSMNSQTTKLEDTIFCNNRNISKYGGWNPNGGSVGDSLEFTTESYSNLNCSNETDQFSISNPKAPLTYPIGLMTKSEMNLLKNYKLFFRDQYIKAWLMTPQFFNYNRAVMYKSSAGGVDNGSTEGTSGVRPVISLKPGTKYRYGDGSKNNPYIIE